MLASLFLLLNVDFCSIYRGEFVFLLQIDVLGTSFNL